MSKFKIQKLRSATAWTLAALLNLALGHFELRAQPVLPQINVRAFGARGNGTIDDTPAFQAALTALGGNGGTVFIPPGAYRADIDITNSNVHLLGTGTAKQGSTTVINPWTLSRPVIQIGSTNQGFITFGTKLENLNLHGAPTGSVYTNTNTLGKIGFAFYGGAVEATLVNCSATAFIDGNVRIVGGATQPASVLHFYDCRFAMHPQQNVGLWIRNNPATYTTDIEFFGCHFNGGNSGYVFDIDGVQCFFMGGYTDYTEDHGFRLANTTGGVFPTQYFEAHVLDNAGGGSGSQVGIDVVGAFPYGPWSYTAGALYTSSRIRSSAATNSYAIPNLHSVDNSVLTYNLVHGDLQFIANNANWTNSGLSRIYSGSADALTFGSAGRFLFEPAAGFGFQINQTNNLALTLNIDNYPNRLYGESNSISLYPGSPIGHSYLRDGAAVVRVDASATLLDLYPGGNFRVFNPTNGVNAFIGTPYVYLYLHESSSGKIAKLYAGSDGSLNIAPGAGGSLVLQDDALTQRLNITEGGNIELVPESARVRIQGLNTKLDLYDSGHGSTAELRYSAGEFSLQPGSAGYLAFRDGAGGGLVGTMSNTNTYFVGPLGIGDTTPAALFTVGNGDKLQVSSAGNLSWNTTTGWGLRLNNLTTAQKTALDSPPVGATLFDVTANEAQYRNNAGAWISVPGIGGPGGSGTDNHLTRWDGVSAVQDSVAILSDIGQLTALDSVTATNALTGGSLAANGAGTGIITIGPGTTNVITKSGSDLIYTNGAAAVKFTIQPGTAADAVSFGVTSGGNAQILASAGDAVQLEVSGDADAVIFDGSQWSASTDNTLDLGSSASNGAWKDIWIKGSLYAQKNNDGAGNYERGRFYMSETNQVRIAAQTAGTGADNIDINLVPAGTGAVTLAAQLANTFNSVASTPAEILTGTWFTGGSSTTTKPHLLIEPTGTPSTAWSANGTGLGINAASGLLGNLIDAQVNGALRFSVNSSGRIRSESSLNILGGLENYSAQSNANFKPDNNGPQISRAVADANPALLVQQVHVSSTGDILQLKNDTVNVATVSRTGATALSGALTVPSGRATNDWRSATATIDTSGTVAGVNILHAEIGFAASDETTAITAGTNKFTFRMPYAMTVTSVEAYLVTAQTSGNLFTVDINEATVSILSTKITIDNGDLSSLDAATPPVISDTALANHAVITVDVDQIGDGTAKGLKFWIIGTRQ